jgi:hypothetical protein
MSTRYTQREVLAAFRAVMLDASIPEGTANGWLGQFHARLQMEATKRPAELPEPPFPPIPAPVSIPTPFHVSGPMSEGAFTYTVLPAGADAPPATTYIGALPGSRAPGQLWKIEYLTTARIGLKIPFRVLRLGDRRPKDDGWRCSNYTGRTFPGEWIDDIHWTDTRAYRATLISEAEALRLATTP